MVRSPATVITPNAEIRERMRRMPSPRRLGQQISRRELAQVVNTTMEELFPGRDLTKEGLLVNERWIGEVMRGQSRWPQAEERRVALRRVFEVDTDAQLGLYSPRRTGELVVDEDAADRRRTPGAIPHQRTVAISAPPQTRQIAVDRPGNASLEVDTSVVHPARRYNYWLGGKDHFAADRASGDHIEQGFPTVRLAALHNRAFMRRAVDFLARAGVRQFLDIGTGLPAPDNTHEVAQRVAADARVVYVDNDPIVMVHARALLSGDPRGQTGYLQADVRDPDAILSHPTLSSVLDLGRPVALLLVAVLHFIVDDDEASRIVRRLTAALPSGSYVVISHATMDFSDPAGTALYEQMFASGQVDARARTKQQLGEFFTGLDLITPDIVAVPDWLPEASGADRAAPADVAIYGAVARIP